jgi:cytochrome c-type biogenesis protein CcmH/NrfF
MTFRALALLAVLAGALPVPKVLAAPTQQEVEESLTCQCGCGLTVHSCNHLQCSSGEPMKKEISERIAKGEDKDTILASFRTRFGEKVLSAPTFRGFNWFAWLTPFAAVLSAGLVLVLVIRRRGNTQPIMPTAPQASDDLRARLARELAALDEES